MIKPESFVTNATVSSETQSHMQPNNALEEMNSDR